MSRSRLLAVLTMSQPFEAFLRGHALYDLSAGVESDRTRPDSSSDAAIATDPDYAAAHAMRANHAFGYCQCHQ